VSMEMHQEFSPEQQIVLIAEDVTEVKAMVKELEGHVGEIKVWLVGKGERAGIFETIRVFDSRLKELERPQEPHTHPELEGLRTEMRIFIAQVGGAVAAVVTVVTIGLRFWPTH
jgi:hypothetical protein